jgi:hypothetical protein
MAESGTAHIGWNGYVGIWVFSGLFLGAGILGLLYTDAPADGPLILVASALAVGVWRTVRLRSRRRGKQPGR